MKLFSSLVLFTAICLGCLPANAQIVVDPTPTATYCVNNVLLGAGITASNITFSGNSAQLGTFDATGTTFPIQSGVILSTGAAIGAIGPNNSGSSTATVPAGPGDADLTAISGVTMNDRAILEFDFTATGDSLIFKYVFASDEYPEFVNGGVNDAFGFFLSGPGITGTFSNSAINIAEVPGGGGYVSINNVNNGNGNAGPCQNCAYYVANGTGSTPTVNVDLQYDGHTTVMLALAQLQCGQTYHIKLAIADGGDNVYDSGVFLEAKSFTTNLVEIDVSTANFDTISGLGATIVEGCDDAIIALIRENSDSLEITHFGIAGTAVNGTDYLPIPDSVIFPVGVDTVYLTISTIEDDLLPGGGVEIPESIIITTSVITPCNDTLYESDTIWILEEPNMFIIHSSDTTIYCPGNDSIQLWAMGAGGIPSYTYTWDNSSVGSTYWVDITTNGVYQIPIEMVDSCALITVYDTVTVTVSLPSPFSVDIGNDTTLLCTGPFPVSATVSGGSPNFLYAWNGGFPQPNSNANFNVTGSGWYYVTAYDGCFTNTSDSIYITVNAPLPNVFTSNDTTIACPGDPATLFVGATGGTPPYDFLWTATGTTTSVDVVTPSTTTTYYVEVTDGCLPTPFIDSVTVSIQTYPPLVIDLPDQTPTCIGDDLTFTPNVTGGNSSSYTFAWNGAPMSGTSITVSPGANTTYVFTVTDGCGIQTSQNVNVTMPVYGPILVNMSGPDSVCLEQLNPMSGTATGGAGGYNYNWAGPGSTYFTNPNGTSTDFATDSTGFFYLTATDQCGNVGSDFILIIGVPCELEIPNILTPNGDGLNDIFFVRNIERFGNHVTISNRWGQIIFESANYQNTWVPPSNLSDGTYFYYIILDDGRQYNGHVTILKE